MNLTFYILTIISGIGIGVCKIWAIISFLIYLFKDTPFNWDSIYYGITFIVVYFISSILSLK